ncbi:MAG: hypothetical protein M3394_02195 [Actinomycetota bacterium]|nr:hypothetical protein [Actinomycetota bacterium]
MRKLAVLAAAVAGLGMVPADAVEATTVSLVGYLSLDSGLSSGTSVTITGSAPCTTGGQGAGADTNAGACTVNLAGSASGTCLDWSGRASGAMTPSVQASSSGLGHSLSVAFLYREGTLTFTGFARDASGARKEVVGVGTIANGSAGPLSCGPTTYQLVASLTLTDA